MAVVDDLALASESVDAISEVRRLTNPHDLTDTPGLADTLTALARGEHVTVTRTAHSADTSAPGSPNPDAPAGRSTTTTPNTE